MRKLPIKTSGTITLKEYNNLVAVVNQLIEQPVGPGLGRLGGVLYATGGGGTQSMPPDPKVILNTSNIAADTDTYDYRNDPDGVEVGVLTAVGYDSTLHKFVYKYRAFTFDKNGLICTISAEGITDITGLTSC